MFNITKISFFIGSHPWDMVLNNKYADQKNNGAKILHIIILKIQHLICAVCFCVINSTKIDANSKKRTFEELLQSICGIQDISILA